MSAAPFTFTFDTCDRDPVNIPQAIQPHGFLLAASVDPGCITHASQNFPGQDRAGPLGQTLKSVLSLNPAAAALLDEVAMTPDLAPRPISLQASWKSPHDADIDYHLLIHHRDGMLLVEGESPLPVSNPVVGDRTLLLDALLLRMGNVATLDDLCRLVTDEMRRITGFDRVLIYQFDAEWNGSVVAESRNDVLPAYLHHRFPAADIPRPARDFYHINRMRSIASSEFTPVPIQSISSNLAPLDLTHAFLRSISPIHLEYMRNMGTGASMSVSLMLEGKLWGLLSCHSARPHRVPFATRTACDLIGNIFSLQLATRERARTLTRQIELRAVLSRLIVQMATAADFADGLNAADMLALTGAHGAAVIRGDHCYRFGRVPDKADLLPLRDWLRPRFRDGIFSTHFLGETSSPLSRIADSSGGLLAVSISPAEKLDVVWFRAEQVQTILWGGDPHQNAPHSDGLRMSPRKSFESWKEIVRGHALPWEPAEVDAAENFRKEVVDLVLRQMAEKAAMTAELQRMNHELEAFAYTVSHDLRAPFRHIHGFAELLDLEKRAQLDEDGRHYLHRILSAAQHAGELVETLLSFSRMNLASLESKPVDLHAIFSAEQATLAEQNKTRQIQWTVAKLPSIIGDPALLRLAVQNLLENAVKYTSLQPIARIEVLSQTFPHEWVISIRDNGIGFDMRYVEKLFGIFQRLHSSEEFPGLGIGLATVKRIIERHRGRIWAEGQLDAGATFYFSLPRQSPQVPQIPPLTHV